MSDQALFNAALDAVYGPQRPAYCLVQHTHDFDPRAVVTNLRQWDPAQGLPAFTTWAAPTWFDPSRHLNRPGLITTKDYENPAVDKYARLERRWSHANPFLIVETDYLIYPGKDQFERWAREFTARGLPPDYLASLQKDAVAFALQAAGYPFNMLIDSGGKSIHAVTYLHDDPQWLASRRPRKDLSKEEQSEWWGLEEALSLALGNFDVAVERRSGTHGLARTPFGLRDNGQLQKVLAVNAQQFKAADVYSWARGQLSDECVAYLTSRPAANITKGGTRSEWLLNPWRMQMDRPYGWRDLLLNQVPHGGGNGSMFSGRQDYIFRVNKELAKAGSKPPRMIKAPQEAPPIGRWDASFLWYLQGRVMDALNEGFFFAADDRFIADHRTNWPAAEDISEKHEEDGDRRATEAVVDVWMAQREAKIGVTGHFEEVAPGYLQGANPSSSVNKLGEFLRSKNGASGPAGKPTTFNPSKFVQPLLQRIGAYDSKPIEPLVVQNNGEEQKAFYQFTGQCWTRSYESDLHAALVDMARETGCFGFDQEGDPVTPSTAKRNEILTTTWLSVPNRNRGRLPPERKDCAVFPNGTLYWDFSTGTHTFRHNYFDPNDRMLTVLPYELDATCPTPLWDSMLNNIFDPESRRAFEEMVGVALFTRMAMKTVVLIDGTPNAGKTTLVNVIAKIFGDSSAPLDFEEWHNTTFNFDGLEMKRFLYNSEVDTDASGFINWRKVWAELKKLTGGDNRQIRKKGQSSVMNDGRAFVMMTSNDDLPLTHIGAAGLRRLAIFNCGTTVGKKINDLEDLIVAEHPGIAALLVRAVSRWMARDGLAKGAEDFVQSFDVPESVLRLREQRAEDSQVENEFLEEMTNKQVGAVYCLKAMWRHYRAWYADNVSKRGNPGTFREWYKSLESFGHKVGRLRGSSEDVSKIQGVEQERNEYYVIYDRVLIASNSAQPPVFTNQDGLRSSKDVPFEFHGTAQDNRPLPFPSRG